MSTSALINAMLADSPSALWPMDDPVGSSQATDRSGNGRHLTYNGSPSLASVNLLTPESRVWNPLLNAAQYGSISPAPAWANPGAGDWVFCCWFRGSTLNATASSFEALCCLDQNDSGNGIDVYIVNTWASGEEGTLRIWYAGSVIQTTLAQQGPSVHNGALHLLWFEKRSGTVYVYLDGVLCSSAVRGTPSVGTPTALYIGRTQNQGNPYGLNNPIACVGIWSGVTIPAAGRQAIYLALGRGAGVVIG